MSVDEEANIPERGERELVDSYDLICVHDEQGRLLSVNAAAEKALGYPHGAWVGRHLQGFLVPETRHLFSAYLAEILANGSSHGIMRMRAANGDVHDWEYHNSEQRLGQLAGGAVPDFATELRMLRKDGTAAPGFSGRRRMRGRVRASESSRCRCTGRDACSTSTMREPWRWLLVACSSRSAMTRRSVTAARTRSSACDGTRKGCR